jgi:hypothetical protein
MAETNYAARSPFRSILFAGLLAGVLDIIAACVQFYMKTGKGPGPVLRYIASGVFGKKASTGGMPMAAWGLFFHFVIAFLFTMIFFWIYPKIKFLSRNLIMTGLVYGLLVWVIMNQVVVPLSSAQQGPFVLKQAIKSALIIMFCVGLPIALIIGKYYSKNKFFAR